MQRPALEHRARGRVTDELAARREAVSMASKIDAGIDAYPRSIVDDVFRRHVAGSPRRERTAAPDRMKSNSSNTRIPA